VKPHVPLQDVGLTVLSWGMGYRLTHLSSRFPATTKGRKEISKSGFLNNYSIHLVTFE
jgi:hypothetical protein